MHIQFATCDRNRALGFLQKLYPSYPVSDTPESAGPLLDLIQADKVRVTDPDCHTGMIVPGTHWNEESRADVVTVCENFHRAIGISK